MYHGRPPTEDHPFGHLKPQIFMASIQTTFDHILHGHITLSISEKNFRWSIDSFLPQLYDSFIRQLIKFLFL